MRTSIDFSALQPILLHEELSTLPTTLSVTELEQATDFLTNALFLQFERRTEDKPTLTKAEFLEVVTSFMNEAQTDDELSVAFVEMANLSSELYTHYKQAMMQLQHTLAPTVESMSAAITDKMSTYLKQHGLPMLATTEGEDTSPFMQVRWDALQLYGGKSFLEEEISHMIGFTLGHTSYSESTLSYILHKLDTRLESIDLTDGEFEEAVKQIEALDTNEDPEQPNESTLDTTACFRILCSPTAYAQYLYHVQNSPRMMHPAELVMKSNSDLKRFYHVIRNVHRTSVSFSDAQTDAINRNITIVRKALLAVCYQMLYADHVYADALLLSPTHVNAPVMERYLQQGGTEEQLQHYVQLSQHHKRVIPRTGISMSWFMSAQEKNQEEYEAYSRKQLLQKQNVLNEARARGFDTVCCAHMQTVAKAKTASDLAMGDFCRQHYAVISGLKNQLYGEDRNTEDVLYQYLFDVTGTDYLTQSIYRRYQQSSATVMEEQNELSDSIMRQAEQDIQMDTMIDLLRPLLFSAKK